MHELRLSEWIDDRQRSGFYCFNRTEAEQILRISMQAMSKALVRLQNKRRIRRIRKQFYVILPVEYAQIGMIPADWFIDELMEYLGESYYVGLLTAAGLHGAGHQQAQEYQVVVERYLQPIKSSSLSIRFFNKQRMSSTPVQQVKGHAGTIPVSTPAATAFDLVRHANRVGGIDSVAIVLTELSEVLQSEDLSTCCRAEPTLSIVQRLGWIMDCLGQNQLADALFEQIRNSGEGPPRALLDPSAVRSGHSSNRWKVIENVNLDLET